MEFRAATEADCTSLAALSIEVWLGTYLREGVGPVFAEYALDTFTPQHFDSLLRDPRHSLIVAALSVGPVGFVQMSRATPCPISNRAEIEIAHLYVQPRHARKGIGARLLRKAVELANAPVWLIANVENTDAIAFYTAQGFAEVGQGGFEIDGVSYPQVILLRED